MKKPSKDYKNKKLSISRSINFFTRKTAPDMANKSLWAHTAGH
jgi:hypothetical protein